MLPSVSQQQDDLNHFTDVFGDEIVEENLSQPFSLATTGDSLPGSLTDVPATRGVKPNRPLKHTGQHGEFRSIEEIDQKYRCLFSYPYFNLVQSRIIEDALYSDKSMVVCAPTGSGKTVVFELAILQLLMEMEDAQCSADFKIIYMAPVKAVCNERLTEWYPKLTKLGLLCVEVTGDTEVDFAQLKPYRVIITTPEKWDMLTRRWRDHRGLVEMIKLFLIDEVHILNDETRGPVLEAVVSRMKTVESAAQSAHRIEQLQKQYQGIEATHSAPPKIRFVAVSATVSNPEDVADWLGTSYKPAVFHKFGDECRPVRLQRIVEGYPCAEGTSIFKFDLILNYKLWPIIQRYYNGKPTLIFCNTRKSVTLTAETLSREVTVGFSLEQKAKLTALASTIKNKKLQMLVMSGVGCHHAGLLYEERVNIEQAFRNRDLPILITTTTLAMGVNLPAHLVIVKNTQQYVNGAYQEYSISTVLQMVGRAGRPQFDTEATAVIMTRLCDKPRYQALVGGSEPLQSYLHKRIAENLNSEAALGTVTDVAQCVEWLRSTFLYVRAAKDPKRYLGLPLAAPMQLILKKIEELCVKAMNSLASSGLITMDEACCIESTEAGRLMSLFYLDVETMKNIMKIEGSETLERLLWLVCESHELSDMHLRVDERRCLNLLNRNNAAATIRFPMKGKISTRQMKLNCIIQAILGCLPISDPSLNQEAMKVMKTASRVCKCLVRYVTHPDLVSRQSKCYQAILNSVLLSKCMEAHLWENSPYVSKQLKGIGPTFSTLLATSGITNFRLLDESHPRDLERIMNKGPPAGNLIRKQVSLLPKYQFTVTPIDSQSVSVQLNLLNLVHLSENMNQLTAGDSHKSYIIVGDSENNLLLLTQFTDNDLISVYDGTMRYEIARKLRSEHKILIHCVSSVIVGIDAHTDYLFLDLEPQVARESDFFISANTSVPRKNVAVKQTAITDVYKERKRKSADNDITQSKEKKKREDALTQKIKALKESFGKTSKALKHDVDKSAKMSKELMHDLLADKTMRNDVTVEDENQTIDLTTHVFSEPVEEIIINDNDDIDDSQIDSILSKIESEISGNNSISNNIQSHKIRDIVTPAGPVLQHNTKSIRKFQTNETRNENTNKITKVVDKFECKKRKNINMTKSNFSCIDLIEKKATTDTDDAVICTDKNNDSGFSDTIKSQIGQFLQRIKNKTKSPTSEITELLHIPIRIHEELPEVYVKTLLRSEENISVGVEEHEVIGSTKYGNETHIEIHESGKNDSHINKCVEDHERDSRNSTKSNNERNVQDNINNISEILQENVAIEQNNINEERSQEFQENLNLPEVYLNTASSSELNMREKSQVESIKKYSIDDIATTKCDSQNIRCESLEVKNSNVEQDNAEDANRNVIFANTHTNTHKTINNYNVKPDTFTLSSNTTNVLLPTKVSINEGDKHTPVNRIKNNLNRDEISNNAMVPYRNNVETKRSNNNPDGFRALLVPCGKVSQSVQNISDKNNTMMVQKSEILYEDDYENTTPAITLNSIDLNTQNLMNDLRVMNVQPSTSNEISKYNNIDLHNLKSRFQNRIPGILDRCAEHLTVSKSEHLANGKNYNDYCNNPDEPHFKKISYTATKVDVCTKKYTEIHDLRITRKLKIDLDMEIVKQDKSETNEYTTNEHDGIINEQNDVTKQPLSINTSKLNLGNEIYNLKNEHRNEISMTERYSHTENFDLRELPLQDLEENQKYSSTENTIDRILQTDKYNFINESSMIDRRSHTEDLKLKEVPLKSMNLNPKFSSTKNSIGNILQKYSKILVKRETSAPALNAINRNTESTSNTTVVTKTAESKSRKPFKISQINNMDVPLPDTLTNAGGLTLSTTNTVITKPISNVKSTINETVSQNAEVNVSNEINITSNICDNNDSFHESPISVHSLELDPIEDIKDESMLDPKLLLQHFREGKEDTDIIAPPAAFCDDVYPSNDSIQYELNELYKGHQHFEDEMESTVQRNENFGEIDLGGNSHMYDNSNVQLPPKEIETWCLSRDDECDTYASQPVPTAPWIISQRMRSSQANDNLGVRRGNLCQFKFVRKKPLRF